MALTPRRGVVVEDIGVEGRAAGKGGPNSTYKPGAYKRPQRSPHSPLPLPPRAQKEPVGAAAPGRTAPLPLPAAAAQHRPAGSEARRAEPRAPSPAAPFVSPCHASKHSTSVPRWKTCCDPSIGSSKARGRCTHPLAPFSSRRVNSGSRGENALRPPRVAEVVSLFSSATREGMGGTGAFLAECQCF